MRGINVRYWDAQGAEHRVRLRLAPEGQAAMLAYLRGFAWDGQLRTAEQLLAGDACTRAFGVERVGDEDDGEIA
jgi:hypothetical protein